LKVTWWS